MRLFEDFAYNGLKRLLFYGVCRRVSSLSNSLSILTNLRRRNHARVQLWILLRMQFDLLFTTGIHTTENALLQAYVSALLFSPFDSLIPKESTKEETEW